MEWESGVRRGDWSLRRQDRVVKLSKVANYLSVRRASTGIRVTSTQGATLVTLDFSLSLRSLLGV